MSFRFLGFYSFWLLNVIFVTKFAFCQEEAELESDNQEFVICRQCGADIADPHYLFNKLSPHSRVSGDKELFGIPHLKIQELINPLGIRFQVINTKKAACSAQGKWHDADTWYPGYSWRHCVCPRCNSHLGWVFEPTTTATAHRDKPSKDGFYALIVDGILSEKLVDSLMVLPQFRRT